MEKIKYLLIISLLCLSSGLNAASPKGTKSKPNRLINSNSPYLRQHAYHPVNWYPWGKEALNRAKKENKPILLSVGYSTCHWCHVMARESYADPKVAEIINRYFIAIKVDRERRPDVDETYMIATELIAKRGGWPNNVFLTPDLKPFYAGTYFPKPRFIKVLNAIGGQWLFARDDIQREANRYGTVIDRVLNRRFAAKALTPEVLKNSVSTILTGQDRKNGGFSVAPKFPQEAVLSLLAHVAKQDGNKDALGALEKALDGILNGGIYDHVGGGFHRYAIDSRWKIPHFEKMLYNQALMAKVLLEAHSMTGNPRYAYAAKQTLKSVQRELTSSEGGFYSAFDAESEGREGAFYVWTKDELVKVLGDKDAGFVSKIFTISDKGNFKGKIVLSFDRPPSTLAQKLNIKSSDLRKRLTPLLAKLLMIRNKRKWPLRDEKIITAWNGMMIAAFAEAASQFDDQSFKQSAIKAAEYIWSKMRKGKTDLYRVSFEGKASIEGTLDDYAHMALAFIALYDLTSDKVWLERAEILAKRVNDLFADKNAGDYYRVASQQTFIRGKSRTDGPVPSGNAVALEMFAKLSKRSQNPDHRLRAEGIISSLSGIAVRTPLSNAYIIRAADIFRRGKPGTMAYLAKGTVKANARMENGQLRISLNIAPGWHINSDKPLEDFLIPTSLSLVNSSGTSKAIYPKPIIRKLGFHSKKLALYEGKVDLSLPVKPGKKLYEAKLHLQACSDQICLDPETVILKLYK